MSYLGKTVPVASIASTQEGRALLEANNVEEQRSLLSVDSTAESDVKLANKQDNLVANDPAVKTALNATGAAPIYACRAWVNFNGTGTVAIRASGNVSSITDRATGLYTINFTTAMSDVNYITQSSSDISGTEGPSQATFYATNYTTSSCYFAARDGSGVAVDSGFNQLAVFR